MISIPAEFIIKNWVLQWSFFRTKTKGRRGNKAEGYDFDISSITHHEETKILKEYPDIYVTSISWYSYIQPQRWIPSKNCISHNKILETWYCSNIYILLGPNPVLLLARWWIRNSTWFRTSSFSQATPHMLIHIFGLNFKWDIQINTESTKENS